MTSQAQQIAIQGLNILSLIPFTTHVMMGRTYYINLNISHVTDQTQVYKISRIEEDFWSIDERIFESEETTITPVIQCITGQATTQFMSSSSNTEKILTSCDRITYDQVVIFIKELKDIKMIWMNTHQSFMPNSVSYLYTCDIKADPSCRENTNRAPPPPQINLRLYDYPRLLCLEGIYLLSLLPFRIREHLSIKNISLIVESNDTKTIFSRISPDIWKITTNERETGGAQTEDVYKDIITLKNIKKITIVPQGQPEDESELNLQSDIFRENPPPTLTYSQRLHKYEMSTPIKQFPFIPPLIRKSINVALQENILGERRPIYFEQSEFFPGGSYFQESQTRFREQQEKKDKPTYYFY